MRTALLELRLQPPPGRTGPDRTGLDSTRRIGKGFSSFRYPEVDLNRWESVAIFFFQERHAHYDDRISFPTLDLGYSKTQPMDSERFI